jgi:hypothetical protein
MLGRRPQRLRSARRALVRRHWRLLLETAVALGWSSIQLRCLPFRRLSRQLGAMSVESPQDLTPGAEQAVREVRLAIRVVATRWPWTCSCLVRALAGRRLLGRRGLSCTLYLGLNPRGGPLRAHAWLRSGNLFVTGRQSAGNFHVVSRFGSSPTRLAL